MDQYKITYEETLVGEYYVDANSPREALEEFRHMAEEGEIDFNDMELISSSETVELPSE